MSEEPWMADFRREAAHDRRMAGRPRCCECRQPIEDRFLPVGEGEAVCSRCIRWRMVEVEGV